MPRAARLSYWAIGVSFFLAAAAVLPIVAAIVGGGRTGAGTAFASAPPGAYLVGARAGEFDDTILVAPADDPTNWTEIAKVEHLSGYSPTGAVSPDGRSVALVVADAGTPAHPAASLLVVELESGAVTRVATGVDELQTVAWAPSGEVVFTRNLSPESARTAVTFSAVDPATLAERELGRVEDVLGAYTVGFDPEGRLVAVAIDNRGSTVLRDFAEVQSISAQITRDWRLSPDGAQLAFIESDVTYGLRYEARLVSLDGGLSAAQAPVGGTQALGVAWSPAGVTFGREPAVVAANDPSAQQVAGGFDVPLSYSPDGAFLAVEHWDGASFAAAGRLRYEVVAGANRTTVSGVSAIYGWAVR